MISICIPVFNFNITSLVEELHHQAELLNIPYEIIIIDDGSDHFKEINKKAAEKSNYIELSENMGRAKIRNLFLAYAQYDFLLFLDCDSLIRTSDFLSNYIEIIKNYPGVVVGGRVYDTKKPGREKMLRWKYGTLKESKDAAIRNRNPYSSFMTNNFLVNKNILEETRFDERLINYGHEDTLFGFSLKENNVPIMHIDNPVLNGDIETNREYLEKTNESVKNLVSILHFSEYDKDLISSISLLRYYNKIKKGKWAIHKSFILVKPMIVFLLRKGYVSLNLFDYYKLGILIESLKREEKLHV